MFYQPRYQTGELKEIVEEMKKGNIPCMDVEGPDDFEFFVKKLLDFNIYKVEEKPYDKNARDGIKEPEFEFRAAFYYQPSGSGKPDRKEFMYIDVYFEPDHEETYDSVGEM